MYIKDNKLDSALVYLPQVSSFKSEKNRINFLNTMIYLKKKDLTKAHNYCLLLPRQEYSKTYKVLGLK